MRGCLFGLTAVLLAPLVPVSLWWCVQHPWVLVPLGVALLVALGLPAASGAAVVIARPAIILSRARSFGRVLGGRERLWLSRAALVMIGVLLLGPAAVRSLVPAQLLQAEQIADPRVKAAVLAPLFMITFMNVLWYGMLALALVLLFASGRVSKAHGDAHFARIGKEFGDRRRAVAALLVRKREGWAARRRFVRPLTPASSKLVFLTWEQLSRHMLVVGATGAGKTTGFFNHLMLSAAVPWIYQDQKAELPLRRRFPDRPVWGLDTRGYATRSEVWNPLDELRSPADVEVLAALLFPDRPQDPNLWVVRGARRIFETLLKAEHHDSIQSLAWSLENEPSDRLLRRLPPGSAATLNDPRTRGHYLSELLEVLRPWTSSRVASVTRGRSTVTLDTFMRRGGYVLCNEGQQELRSPVAAFWGLLLHRLRSRPAGAEPLMLLLDEFGDAGRIPHMAQALALYRSKNVALVAGVQSYALMESVYATEWKAVRDGFGTVFVLTANMDRGLAERLSRELGQFTKERSGLSVTAHMSAHGPTFGPSFGAGQETGVSLVPVDQWGRWSDGRACLARAAWPTWWVPCSIEIDPAPLAAMDRESDVDWRVFEAKRVAALAPPVAALGDGSVPCVQCGGRVQPREGACSDCGSAHEAWRVF